MQHIGEGIDSSGLHYVRNIPSDDHKLLLVALHGHGKCRTHLFDLLLKLDAALPVVAVQAPYRLGPGAYRWFGYQPGSSTETLEEEWFASAWRLSRFLDNLSDANPGRELCLVGHSQGGMMALDMALAHPELIRRCACIGGRLLPQSEARLPSGDSAALRGSQFLFAHGDDDAVVPAHKGRAAGERLRRAAAHVRFAAYPGGHEPSPAMLGDVATWLKDAPRDPIEPIPRESP